MMRLIMYDKKNKLEYFMSVGFKHSLAEYRFNDYKLVSIMIMKAATGRCLIEAIVCLKNCFVRCSSSLVN